MGKKQKPARFKRKVLKILAQAAYNEYKSGIPSATLREALTIEIQPEDLGVDYARLHLPHYWAVHLHDGHSGVHPVTAKFLVYFQDPRDDPRWSGKWPVKKSDIRRLTHSEYKAGLAKNAQRARTGGRPYMYVVRGPNGNAGKIDPVEGKKWYLDPIRFRQTDLNAIMKLMDGYVGSYAIKDRATAHVRFSKRRV